MTINKKQIVTMQSLGMINDINLCDSCRHEFATCKAEQIIWGTGKGNDNIAACHQYDPAGIIFEDVEKDKL